jgi:hypothetical protein
MAAAVFAVAAFFVYGGEAAQISVSGPDGRWLFPTDAAETVRVRGPLGVSVVEIRDGRARILSSPCPNQTCVSSAPAARPGQWVACLPNRVMVRVDGADADDALDGATW